MRRLRLAAQNAQTGTAFSIAPQNLKPEQQDSFSTVQYEWVWTVAPFSTPTIIRRCSRCSSNRFSSSDKFRVNANKKIIDVWLIYKCIQCDFTVNQPIISRTAVSKIDRALLVRFHENDKALAWQYAFDANLLQRAQLDWNIDFDIQSHVVPDTLATCSGQNADKIYIAIKADYFLKISVFAVLRQKLKMSRNQLEKLQEKSELTAFNLNGEVMELKNAIGKDCMIQVSMDIVVPSPLILLNKQDSFI